MNLELGIDHFGDITHDEHGQPLPHAQVVRNVVAEGVLADAVGVDFIGLGEHHRDDFAISAPEMVLAAIAARTERIRLGSAVTVLSSDDPVRVWERFSTLDALSDGRAEVILGRGSFTESFPLFGYALGDYEALFEEKLALFAALRTEQPVTWQGTHTQQLDAATLYPTLEHGPLPAWVAVGGSPQSVIRAAHHGLPLMLAIIGGPVARFAPFADLYRRALAEFEQPEQPIGYHSFGHIAETDEQAVEEFYDAWLASVSRIGSERGWSRPTRESFLHEVEHGSMVVGSPETAARKIAAGAKALGASRFDVKVSTGPLSHEAISRSIELYGTTVAPLVRDMLA
ncbi:LLM class flavin-dependent oxidoreductase [Propioniciclava soli]|uniref:LLM class flavin-dependent oxidoreductase n=1 Tax=Propioniciclava soli TaxID=2775081 RepID=A0ABZ3C4G5_9ACTN|nr:LLM class flavin-dependent oxidoreductase [Propioniciclava soli]